MSRYLSNHVVAQSGASLELCQVHNQIATLTEQIKVLTKLKVGREQLWCVGCRREGPLPPSSLYFWGYIPLMRGVFSASSLFIGRPVVSVVQVAMASPFHNMALYQGSPSIQQATSREYYSLFSYYGHPLRHCPILQKYTYVRNTTYCELCSSSTYSTDKCSALDALEDMLDRTSFRVSEESQGG